MTEPIAPTPIDPAGLRRLYGCFPSGVVAVCGAGPDGPVGLAASSFTSVSLDPPLVSFCIGNSSATWPRLAALPRLGVSVLAAGHGTACRQLASTSGDRFAGLVWTTAQSGAVFLADAAAHLECAVEQVLPAGDHGIVLLRVEAAHGVPGREPLVFHASAFRELVPPAGQSVTDAA